MSRENDTVDAFRYAGRIELSVRNATNGSSILAMDDWGAYAGLPYVFAVLNISQLGSTSLNVDLVADYRHVLTNASEFVSVRGPIRLRFADTLNETCALGPFSDKACGGNGDCNQSGQCICNGTLVGQYCSMNAPNITIGKSESIIVNFSTFSYYRFYADALTLSNATNYAVEMTLNGQDGCPELYVKSDNGSYRSMPVFQSFYPDNNFPANYTDQNGFYCSYTTQNVLLPPDTGTYWVTVANRYCQTKSNPISSANVSLAVSTCGGGSGQCPPPSASCTNPGFLNSWYFLLPILFGGIAGVLGIGLLLAWLFPRREVPMDPGVIYAMGPYVSEEEARRLLSGGIRILPLRGRNLVRIRLQPIPQEKIESVFPAVVYSMAEAATWAHSKPILHESSSTVPTVNQGQEITPAQAQTPNDANTTSYMVLAGTMPAAELTTLRLNNHEARKVVTNTPEDAGSCPAPIIDQREESIAYSNVTCPVCLEDFADGDRVRRVGCHHLFHVDCIDPWLRKHPACPVCREDFSALLRSADSPHGPRSPEPVAQPADVERGLSVPSTSSSAAADTEIRSPVGVDRTASDASTVRLGHSYRARWLRSRHDGNSPSTAPTISTRMTSSGERPPMAEHQP
jgi:hypothetical protein